MIPRVPLRQALADPALLGSVLSGESWRPWRVQLIAAMGESLTDDERAIFKQFTGRDREPGQQVEEYCCVAGRRGGKSRAISVIGTYTAGLCEHPSLAAGERGICLIVAADQRQADQVLDYVTANFEASPILRQLIEQRTARELRLNNGIDIEVRAADFRRLRGLTYIAVIADELAFWQTADYSSNPDSEILDAIRPGLATTGRPLFMISSPYARRGELWNTFNKHYGPAGDPRILVAQGSSRDFNPTLPQSVVDRALDRDLASASAEYLGEFRVDLEAFVLREAVDACVSHGTYERPPERSRTYSAFIDPSAGSSDSMTLCIGHRDVIRKTVTIDVLREAKPPFSPEAVVSEFSTLLKQYRVSKIIGDRFAGIWPVELFSKAGITYEQSARPKSDLYGDLLAYLNSGRIELLDHPKTINQLVSLERLTSRGGRDSIDHPPGAHDDLANVVAGLAASNIATPAYSLDGFQPNFQDRDVDQAKQRDREREQREIWRRAQQRAYFESQGLPPWMLIK